MMSDAEQHGRQVVGRERQLPVRSSNSTTPSEKMSDRPSTFLPAICSGDMYVGVPTTIFECDLLLEAIFAIPKSMTFTTRSFVSMMLAA